MGITKDSIVSSVCGIDSKITLEDLSKHLEMDVEDLIEFEDGDLGDLEGTSELIENDGKLSFNWDGPEDHGITQLLKDVFNEEYLLRVDINLSYGDESYIEIMVFDNKKEIIEHVVNYDGNELTPEEKELHDNRDPDDVYIQSEDISFMKKSEFNKDEIEGQPIVW